MNAKKQESPRKIQYEFSSGVRWTHWIRAISISILVATGFYISYVFIAPTPSAGPNLFLNGQIRMIHEIVGFIFIAVLIYKSYLFIFDKYSHNERISIINFLNPITWIQQIKFYLFLGKHPELKGVYNPLQFVAYLMIYVVFFLLCITGLVLYGEVYHAGLGGFIHENTQALQALFGGLANIRWIHHVCTWIVIVFVPVHVYMAVFNSVINKEGAIDTIISGYKFNKTA